jgi:SAM-dependent methyltransferase
MPIGRYGVVVEGRAGAMSGRREHSPSSLRGTFRVLQNSFVRVGWPSYGALVAEGFDIEAAFNDDYLYFYAERLSDDNSDAEATVVWDVACLERGDEVLDLACGHGRIANRLALRGAQVTGLDATPMFLQLAREDAKRRGVTVAYHEGDMRELPWAGRFDVVFSWFTAFGYFDDDTNKKILRQVLAVLRPGGRFVVHLNHRDALMAQYLPCAVVERDGNLMIDQHRFDPYSGRSYATRTIIRDARVRQHSFFTRLFSFTELRAWLLDTGFETVEGFSGEGADLTATSPRLLVRATKSS